MAREGLLEKKGIILTPGFHRLFKDRSPVKFRGRGRSWKAPAAGCRRQRWYCPARHRAMPNALQLPGKAQVCMVLWRNAYLIISRICARRSEYSQMIVEPPKSDYQMMASSRGVYKNFRLKRVFTCLVPVNHDSLSSGSSAAEDRRFWANTGSIRRTGSLRLQWVLFHASELLSEDDVYF